MGKRISKGKTFDPDRAAEHVKKYIARRCWTRTAMADTCHLSRQIISDLCNAKDRVYDSHNFTEIARATGYICDYWLGLTEETTAEGRAAELQRIKDEAAETDAEEKLHALYAERTAWYKDFFYHQGYRYEYEYERDENGPRADFAILNDQCHPHTLTRYTDGTSHILNEKEFQGLFDRIQREIDFTCFNADRKSATKGPW